MTPEGHSSDTRAPDQPKNRGVRGLNKCGVGGFRKNKNGLHNVISFGGDIAVTKRNAQSSPLLRLIPEIRMLIWGYAVSANPIQMHTHFFPTQVRPVVPTDGFHVLRVCGQTYLEAATLPLKTNDVSFATLWACRDFGLNDTAKLAQRVKFGLLSWEDFRRNGLIDETASIAGLQHVRAIEITFRSSTITAAAITGLMEEIQRRLGKLVTVHPVEDT
ncbi:hypothetical protein EK21DRAFT_107467 [Setomelanomma holmii]|uniref:Uncharacterized protein n=1 Tax=Setomelanomma holmii TaxID=210430 RepID=A0A9P4HKG0_9PLEO|nr:hypothetical protein EK21DRAFT_107467 [Setomelanomma holmii]